MSLVRPTQRTGAISDVSFDELAAAGITCILFDRDNTVVPRDTGKAPQEALAWLDEARARGFKLCMVSNNFHSGQVETSANELGVAVVHHAMKPAPFAVQKAMRLMGAEPAQTVLIGDQVFTDVAAGNLAGVRTILVNPQSTTDLWYTHIFRVFEALIGARKDR